MNQKEQREIYEKRVTDHKGYQPKILQVNIHKQVSAALIRSRTLPKLQDSDDEFVIEETPEKNPGNDDQGQREIISRNRLKCGISISSIYSGSLCYSWTHFCCTCDQLGIRKLNFKFKK